MLNLKLPTDVIGWHYLTAYIVAPAWTLLVASTSAHGAWWLQAVYLLGMCFVWSYFGWASACNQVAENIAESINKEKDNNDSNS